MASSDDHKVNDPLQTQALSEDLQLRNDTLKVEVQISHNELQKQKIARQLLEEKLRTLECQLLDSTVEKEEIKSLLEDLAAQTSACTKAQEQVQKALKDMEELAAANGAAKAMEQLPTAENEVDEGMEPTTQDMLELQQSNEAVKALLKKFCDDFRRQRAERDDFEAKLRSVECQLSDATKQDELKILLQHFALHTAANLKAEAAIQAVLNDLEALKASKDLEVAIASFMGDAKATVAAKAQETLLGQALPESLAPNSAGSEAAAAPVDVPRTVAARRYDLKEPHAFAQFLQDANIRLIRAKYLNDLARSKRPLPRRQEAEESALVSHEEVQNWAKGARTATICSVSHAWETREHPDPCRYQLELIVDRAVWYEAAFETEVWIFYDFTSLFQYERLFSEEERSFRAAMDNMHIMYSHECTMTFMIEHLTPTDVWESTMQNDQELIPVWDVESKSIVPKPLNRLWENRTEYLLRGWCIGEISWSSLRTHNSQSQCIDRSGSDKVEPDGKFLTGKVPLTPERFKERMKDAKFTHRDKDLPLVVELQQKIFDEKVAVCEHLVLKGLPEEEMFALAGALPLYKSLTTLKLDSFECSEESAEAFGKALATSQVVSLELLNPQPGSGAFMGKAVVEALTTNQSLTSINAEDESIFDLAAKKALAKALRKNRSIKERLPFDAPVRLKAVAQALERNSFTNITMDPEYDQVGDEEVKAHFVRIQAVAQLLKTGTSVKRIDLGDTCISDDGAQALAEALRCNQILEELWLHKDQITDVGAEALAEALKVNKTLRSLTVEASWEALRAVEEMKRDRGDNFQFISTEQKEAERCNGSIFQAARDGKVGAVRHLLRTKPTSVQETDLLGDTPLHDAARNGKAKVVELLLAANAPLDVKSKSGNTPLHHAAANGKAAVAELLVAANAPLDVKNEIGNTPMHSAAANGKAAVVELLLAANAPLEVQNKNGETPLHEAAQYGHAEVVQLLLKAEAQVDVQSNNGQTPLLLAAANGHAEVVKLLVEVASLAVQSNKGNTPLHGAARNGKAEVVELLLAANAPLDVQNKSGQTPLDLASENDESEVVQFLEAAQAVAPRPEDE